MSAPTRIVLVVAEPRKDLANGLVRYQPCTLTGMEMIMLRVLKSSTCQSSGKAHSSMTKMMKKKQTKIFQRYDLRGTGSCQER